MKTTLMAVLVVAALGTVGTAQAGGQEGAIGVGAEFGLSAGPGTGGPGIGGLSMNYDAGDFHVGGFLALYDPAGGDNTAYSIGARFYYHLHSGTTADFGLGGTLGILSTDQAPPQDRQTGMYLEPGFQIRMFPSANVALSFTGGLVVGAIDAEGFALTGQIAGLAGVHYYFF